ncbi:hypothetical protein GF359_05250 [candidate division WOR-3 bacterium]|uniref:Yip1 domain-containing protein n=1 Tax=candidate division WOR-3 bacterium TaxID=2052148 RepID=A0A9D5QD05_UNCW3|nr:hypothetical protein [candidate division WOR-3 bacterium]MBD3364602.1 hypothetical protein [candidate division WOR-3 bacterium]
MLNEGRRLVSVYIAPVHLFDDLNEGRSRWWIPLVICLLVGGVAAVLLRLGVPSGVWMDTIRQNLATSGAEMNEAYLEMAANRISSPQALFFAGLGGVISSALGIFVLTLLYWAVFAIFGGKINFNKSITVVAYSGLIVALGHLVRLILSVSLQRLDIYTSLAILPFLEPGSYLFRFASQIEVFTVWRLVVMGLGFSTLASVSRTKGYVLVILPWLVLIALLSFVKIGFGM